ncbi:protein-tyrosine phosphatase-like protein [Apiospora hydei]|uniref:protein-tyrosine-phosphatase n=1 Tax=Apiospora hydei TaxID=1337664 RepID=A0ABR1XBU2_9PEZI
MVLEVPTAAALLALPTITLASETRRKPTSAPQRCSSPTSSTTRVAVVAIKEEERTREQGKEQRKEKGKEEDGAKVLFHCMGGISRSPAVVAYYLMREEGMSLRDALGAIMKARPAMRPNDGFLRQLKELEVGLRGEGTLEGVESLPLETKKRQDLLLSADAKEK